MYFWRVNLIHYLFVLLKIRLICHDISFNLFSDNGKCHRKLQICSWYISQKKWNCPVMDASRLSVAEPFPKSSYVLPISVLFPEQKKTLSNFPTPLWITPWLKTKQIPTWGFWIWNSSVFFGESTRRQDDYKRDCRLVLNIFVSNLKWKSLTLTRRFQSCYFCGGFGWKRGWGHISCWYPVVLLSPEKRRHPSAARWVS